MTGLQKHFLWWVTTWEAMLCAAAVPAFTNCPRTLGLVSARRRLLSYLTCTNATQQFNAQAMQCMLLAFCCLCFAAALICW